MRMKYSGKMHIAAAIAYMPSAVLLALVVVNLSGISTSKWELFVSLGLFIAYTIAITLILRKWR